MQHNVRMWTTCIFKGGGVYGVWNYDKDKISVRSSRQFYKSFTWISHEAQLPDIVKDLIIFKKLINLINASKIIPWDIFHLFPLSFTKWAIKVKTWLYSDALQDMYRDAITKVFV